MATPDRAPTRNETSEPEDLAELCRKHDIGLELLGRVHNVDELIDAIVQRNGESVAGGDGRDGADVRALVEFGARAERERLEAAVRTVGVLTHKINNPLTALLGRVQLLRARAEVDPETAKSAKVVEESALRIADLVRELAGVARDARG